MESSYQRFRSLSRSSAVFVTLLYRLSMTNISMADLDASIRQAIATFDPTAFYVKYGENIWAAVKAHLDATAATAAKPVIEKYTGVLAAADVFTESSTFWVMS